MLILWTYDDSSKYLNVYHIGEFYEYVRNLTSIMLK